MSIDREIVESKSFVKSNIGYIILIAIISILLILRSCEKQVDQLPKEPNTKNVVLNEDTVRKWIKIASNINSERKALKHHTDSLTKANIIHKAKYIALKEANRKILQLHPCDTIQSLQAYDNTFMACDSVINNDSLIIASKDKELAKCDSANLVLSKVVMKQSDVINEIQEDYNWQKSVNDILKKEVKKQKRTKIAVIVGAIVGVVGMVILLR